MISIYFHRISKYFQRISPLSRGFLRQIRCPLQELRLFAQEGQTASAEPGRHGGAAGAPFGVESVVQLLEKSVGTPIWQGLFNVP